MKVSYERLAQNLFVAPEKAGSLPVDYADYDQLDDAHLLSLVETLRPVIYAHVAVVINQATPLVDQELHPPAQGEYDSLLDFRSASLVEYARAVESVVTDPKMENLVVSTEDMLGVLHHARVRGLFNPLHPSSEVDTTYQLAMRGCGSAMSVVIRALDYIYRSIEKGEQNWDPSSLSTNMEALGTIEALSVGMAKRVRLQDLGSLMTVLSGKVPFSGEKHTRFEICPVDLESPHRVHLKRHIDTVHAERYAVNNVAGYDPYMLEHLMCPAVIGMGVADPIPDLVTWVVKNADLLDASTMKQLA